MEIIGFDAGQHEIDVTGKLSLSDQKGNIAAEWSFVKLLEHWNKKHAKAVYIPYKKKEMHDEDWYSYGNKVHLGEGTDFLKFI